MAHPILRSLASARLALRCMQDAPCLPRYTNRLLGTLLLLPMLNQPVLAAPVILETVSQEANTLKFDPKSPNEPGISIEIIRELERIDPEMRFNGLDQFYPTRRIEHEVDTGRIEVFFGLIKTPAREKKMDFIDNPILYTQYGQLAVNMNDNIVINSFDDIRKLKQEGRIGVPQGSAFVEYLKGQGGLMVDDGVVSVTATLQKLMAGHVRFVYFGGAVLNNYIQDEKLGDKIKLLPIRFNTENVHIVASKSLSPEKASRLNAALDKLAKSKAIDRLRSKYGVK